MNTKDVIDTIPSYFDKLRELGLSEQTQYMSRRILSIFQKYCLDNNIEIIDRKEIKEFYNKKFNIDIDNSKDNYELAKIRPVLLLIDYYKTNCIVLIYNKRCNKKTNNLIYDNIINDYLNSDIIAKLSLNSKNREKQVVYLFLNYLNQNKIQNINFITENTVIDYLNSEYSMYNYKTKSAYKCIIRKFLNWLFDNKKISFSGNKILPIISCQGRRPIEKCYTDSEIKSIIDSIDNSNIVGKTKLLVTSLSAYYGLRAGDIANLKYENIDFNNNIISLIQCKTKKPLVLPLIDEVKYPLLDYIKNSKNIYIEGNYILKTLLAPHRNYNLHSISDLLSSVIKHSGIDTEKRKTGSRIFRHSLATNMINNNVPLDKVKTILGHTDKKTSSLYVTVDKNNLVELTLEVPHGNL